MWSIVDPAWIDGENTWTAIFSAIPQNGPQMEMNSIAAHYFYAGMYPYICSVCISEYGNPGINIGRWPTTPHHVSRKITSGSKSVSEHINCSTRLGPRIFCGASGQKWNRVA